MKRIIYLLASVLSISVLSAQSVSIGGSTGVGLPIDPVGQNSIYVEDVIVSIIYVEDVIVSKINVENTSPVSVTILDNNGNPINVEYVYNPITGKVDVIGDSEVLKRVKTIVVYNKKTRKTTYQTVRFRL